MGTGEEVLHLFAETTSHATLENGLLVAWSAKCHDPQRDISPDTALSRCYPWPFGNLNPSLSQRKHELVYGEDKTFPYAVTTSISLHWMHARFFECVCEVWFSYHEHLVNQVYFHVFTLRICDHSEDLSLTSLKEMFDFVPVLQEIYANNFQYGYRELISWTLMKVMGKKFQSLLGKCYWFMLCNKTK